MQLNFSKYQGTGNDFIMIDDRENRFDINNKTLIAHLCHRRFGVGGDGLILLRNHADYDFEMVYFNADGRQSSMCGNGGRCIVAFAGELGVIENQTRFLAIDGAHKASIINDEVSLQMQDVMAIAEEDSNYILNTGSPHFVSFFNDIDTLNVVEKAHQIRYSPKFNAEGINVNFVQPISLEEIKVRTYERGVEDETWSCGTGVVASSIAYWLHHHSHIKHEFAIKIATPGGRLAVSFSPKEDGSIRNIILKGGAAKVFEASINI
ncbi:MAG: diaminopimelate epimerase [Bacteroidetes bacterium]|nr:diaminopimelate epimerase [Bacteroidota bacterium]